MYSLQENSQKGGGGSFRLFAYKKEYLGGII
nr:MAG TPA: hypothetical protein [Caudoviricetes sp.]